MRPISTQAVLATITLSLSSLVGPAIAQAPDTLWTRAYGGTGNDFGRCVLETQDGGYSVVGYTSSFGEGSDDIYLIRLDPSGDTLWTRTYGGSESDQAWDADLTHDGGLIISGRTSSFGAAGQDIYLVRTDANGDTLWTRRYGGASNEVGESVTQASDSGYIVTGASDAFGGSGGPDVYLMKLDTSGDSMWTKVFGGANAERGDEVQRTLDGGYIVVGETHSFGEGADDVYLVKTDGGGDSIWARTYGGTGTDEGYGVYQTFDGGYVLTGRTSSFGSGGEDIYLVKTNSVGDTLWTRTYGDSASDIGYWIRQCDDKGYVITGHTASSGAGAEDVYIMRTDSIGNTLWAQTYGGVNGEISYKSSTTSDGGYIIVGETSSFGAGSSDVYVIRLGTDLTHDCAVVSIDMPPDTVFAESTYAVLATVCNLGIVTETFEVVGTVDGYTDTITVVNLPADSSAQVVFSDWVAPPADSTTYAMRVCTSLSTDADTSNDCAQKEIFAYRPLHDGGVVSLDLPPDTLFADSVYTVLVTMANFGDYAESLFAVATIDGYIDSVRVGDVPPGDLIQAAFADWYVPCIESTYTMTVCAYVANDEDSTNDCGQKSILALVPNGIEEHSVRTSQAMHFRLDQNDPNPLHRGTVISYSLPVAAHVTLEIHDITGRLVETLVNETQQPGIHQARWNRKQNPSGVYFYCLRAGEFLETRKMVVVE